MESDIPVKIFAPVSNTALITILRASNNTASKARTITKKPTIFFISPPFIC